MILVAVVRNISWIFLILDSAVNNYLDYNNVQYQEYPGDVSDYSYQYHPPSSPPHRPHQPPPGWSQHHRVISPQHYQSHSTRRQEIVDRQDAGILSGLGRFLPLLLAIPVMAAASYYLVVLNGPTPVVKERIGDEALLDASLGDQLLDLLVSLVTKYDQHQSDT